MLQDKAHHSDFNSCLLFVHFGSTSYNAATKDQGLHCLKIQKQKTFGGKATEPQFNCTHWLLPTLGGKKTKENAAVKENKPQTQLQTFQKPLEPSVKFTKALQSSANDSIRGRLCRRKEYFPLLLQRNLQYYSWSNENLKLQ